MAKGVTGLLKGSRIHCVVHHAIRTRTRKRDYYFWHRNGERPLHVSKELVVRSYARRFGLQAFIETGTYMGDMVYAVEDLFNKIVTVELDAALCRAATWRLRKLPHASVVQGDSSEVLPALLDGLNEPCLFWLDAHYSGWPTARAEVETPIRRELKAILDHPVAQHVVLIDDASCFNGEHHYPTLDELRALVAARRPGMSFEVGDDIIRLHERNGANAGRARG
jgi:hypothetical protein